MRIEAAEGNMSGHRPIILPDRRDLFNANVTQTILSANVEVADRIVCITAMSSARTLQSVVDSLGEHGQKTALVVLGKKDLNRWSFQKLAACARSFANGLVRQGF